MQFGRSFVSMEDDMLIPGIVASVTGGGEASELYGPRQSYYDDGEYGGFFSTPAIYWTPPLTDYDATMRVFPASFPNKTVFSSRVVQPAGVNFNRISGYGHVYHGNYYGSSEQIPGGSRQLYTLTALAYDIQYSSSGDARTGRLVDCWFTTGQHNSGSFANDEVCAMGWIPDPVQEQINYIAPLPTVGGGTFVDVNGVVWTAKEGGATTGNGSGVPNYLFYRPGYAAFEGVFDILGALTFLINAGKISGNEWFNGLAFGPEMNTGIASTTVDKFLNTALASAARVPWTITNLTATAQSATTVLLAYKNAPGATSHQYRANGGTWTAMPGDKIVTGLTGSTAYTFEVRGVNGTGNGAASNTGNATTSAGVWTPASLPNLVAWYDAQDAETITQSGGTVSSWGNKKSGGPAATQATTGERPAYSATAFNGMPAIVGAAGKQMATTITVAQPFTVAAVAQVTNTAANRALLGSSTTNDFKGLFNNVGAGGLTDLFGGGQWTNGSLTSPTIVSSVVSGAATLLGNNGTTNGAHNPGSGGMTNMSLFNWAATGSDYWVGPIGEVVVCSSALSTGDRQKLEGYLAWKWGLQANLPVGHPHKSAAPTP